MDYHQVINESKNIARKFNFPSTKFKIINLKPIFACVMPRIMWGVSNPKLIIHSPGITIEPYGHSAVLEVPGCKGV
jgi:hypothetical protein